MNKQYYSFGNVFKVKYRKHVCYRCGTELSIIKHYKIVSSKSAEAKYYDFSIGMDGGYMIGSCEFIHNVFYCPNCLEEIEYVTQINQEDIDLLIKNVEKYYSKKGRSILIRKSFENLDNVITDTVPPIEQVCYCCLTIEEMGKNTLVYKIPIRRKKQWERPCYFKVKKKDIVNFVKRQEHLTAEKAQKNKRR